MLRLTFFTLLLIASLWTTHSIAAERDANLAKDCKTITNAGKRLACFDAQQKLAESRAAESARIAAQAEAEKKNAEFLKTSTACLTALRKLESRVRVGISYRDYGAPLAETKFEVESFISSAAAKQNPEFSTHATNALLHFEMANSIWSIKFSSRQVNNDLALTDELLRRYPAAAQYLRKMGSFDLIEYSKMLPIIWNAASQEIAQASDAMTPSPK